MGLIAFNILRPLNMANPNCITPLPTVFALRNIQVHVSFPYSSYDASHVEMSVDDFLYICPTLSVPNINLYYCHIRLGRNFNNIWFRYKDYVIENDCP